LTRRRPRYAAALAGVALAVGACTSSTASDGDDVSIREAPSPGATSEAPETGGREPGEPGDPTNSDEPGDGVTPTGVAPSTAPTSGTSGGEGGSTGSGGTGGTSGTGGAATTSTSTGDSDTQPGKRPVADGVIGIDDDTITLGFEYTEGNASTQRAAGFEGLAPAPAKELHAIMGRYINETGGIAGRELVQVFHVYDAQGRDVSVQEQEACVRFTQDEHVFAVNSVNAVGPGFHTDNYRACITDADTGLISAAGLSVVDDRAYGEFEGYLEPNAMSITGVVSTSVRGLHEQGFFDDATLGVISIDRPRFRDVVDNVMRPALQTIGSSIEEISWLAVPENEGDLGAVAAHLSNTALRFNQAGVNRVMILESGGGVTLLFTNAAESQGYRPTYGLTTVNGLHVIASNVPQGQLDGARFVGWAPSVDVHPDHFPGSWDSRDLCTSIYDDAGQSFDNPNAAAGALIICDGYLFMRAALDAGSGPITRRSFQEGALAMRAAYESPLVRWTSFNSSKRYGVDRYRHGEFAADCRCFRYTSEAFSITR